MTPPRRVALEAALAAMPDLPALTQDSAPFSKVAPVLRKRFASHLYGSIPDRPEALTVEQLPLPNSGGERVKIAMSLPGGQISTDAAIWYPTGEGPWPLICGLDFVGPAGLMFDTDFPLDPSAIIVGRPEFGAHDGRLCDVLRGTSALNWPVSLLNAAGYAVLVSCYGSWAPDHPEGCRDAGLMPVIETPTGAISLWAWAISRLIDIAEECPRIDHRRVAVAGHSRLGKAALWASAHDTRIGAVFASSSGTAGAAPAAHPVGETLTQLRDRFPHWLSPDPLKAPTDLDQHGLIALSSPRRVYLAAAEEDLWADPLGSYMALVAASAVWPDAARFEWPEPASLWTPGAQVTNGTLGFHLREGGHALLPYDWRRFLEFLASG